MEKEMNISKINGMRGTDKIASRWMYRTGFPE